MKKNVLPTGKLPAHLLAKLLLQLPQNDPAVTIPPSVGVDAGGITTTKPLISVTTDPITFSTKRIATYSLCVNMNDIACMGAKPRWYTSNLLLPVGTTETTLHEIWDDLVEQLKKYEITAIGGHIEITPAVNTPVMVGQMIGEAISDRLLTPQDGRAGDLILVCRAPAIEGTTLLAIEKENELKAHFSAPSLREMQQLLDNPSICIWSIAEKIVPTQGLVALHDPTEGGLASALHELADGSGCGLVIDNEAIPLRHDTKLLAKHFNIDPLGLLASGSLLILCKPEAESLIKEKLKHEVIETIGKLTEDKARYLNKEAGIQPLPRFDCDEIIKIL